MTSATINTQAGPENRAVRRRGGGCALGCLTALIVLLLFVGVSWVFAVRPYVHSVAQGQIDSAMSAAVQQIPPEASQLPAGSILKVQENAVNNLIVLNLAPSNPVKNPVTHINPAGVRLEFQLELGVGSFVTTTPNAITAVPKVVNGKLVATNVTVEGLVGLVMSPDEIAALLNKHFAEALARIHHNVQSVQLKEHEMDLQLS